VVPAAVSQRRETAVITATTTLPTAITIPGMKPQRLHVDRRRPALLPGRR
jgi:hypothetical protein